MSEYSIIVSFLFLSFLPAFSLFFLLIALLYGQFVLALKGKQQKKFFTSGPTTKRWWGEAGPPIFLKLYIKVPKIRMTTKLEEGGGGGTASVVRALTELFLRLPLGGL